MTGNVAVLRPLEPSVPSRPGAAASPAIRVLLADSHALVRAGLRSLIEARSSIRVVGETASGDDLVEQVRRVSPDVVILDPRLPALDGVTAITEIAGSSQAAVMVVAAGSDDELA